ncbi:MAG: alpha/beta fold hydrolase [Paludisphaera borealis]|uniref:alpha/beta hydrolase n=1 Tax=Paludisphaera borealis TaxID=1387353 RepID=UPI00283B68A7|nr:alpha/beta fold hydrolase [Paludisphaera borealis]MDR3621527.1 alpha/beta fold hydrolase [Paludisphaera borealis]
MTNLSVGMAQALVGLGLMLLGAGQGAERRVEVALNDAGSLAVSEVVSALAEATGQTVKPPPADVTLPVRGLPGALGRSLLADCLGDEVEIAIGPKSVVFVVPEHLVEGDGRALWKERLDRLSARTEEAASRQQRHIMRARESYRPNDPDRPTICLVHGVNSSSGGFVHFIPPLEEAGYGIVVYDYPFNQKLDDSCAQFQADWLAFRKQAGETRPWTILAHSMGALVARSYVEGAGRNAGDVDSLILIAPVNQGAHIARLQPVLQMISGMRAVQGKRTAQALAELSEGGSQSAEDLLPGSPFLRRINRTPPNEAVAYHILAGDRGVLSEDGRKQVEAQVETVHRNAGVFGSLTRLATGELGPVLDELTDGAGDGCVALARTRLPGAPEPVVLHANHAELIRAPLLFADPGPVVSMPQILEWMKADRARDGR